MRKLIAGINMTVDGICDHTAVVPDEEIHRHYTELIESAGLILYGSTTYRLMQYWQDLLENPSGERSMDEFAMAIDRIPKIVFSHSMKDTGWESAILANQPIEELVKELKHQPGKDILVGSRSLIHQLLKLNLIDEFQLCVHPVIAGSGLPLFDTSYDRKVLKLINSKTFGSGAVLLYFEPIKNER